MSQVQTFNEFLDGFLDEFTVADCNDELINFTPDEVRFLGLFTGRFVCGLLQMRRLVRRAEQKSLSGELCDGVASDPGKAKSASLKRASGDNNQAPPGKGQSTTMTKKKDH